MIRKLKEEAVSFIKNYRGPRLNRKIIVFAVDDYGNVRVANAEAKWKMEEAGLNLRSRYDKLDTLETRDDLSALYDVLSSAKDQHKNSAVFTPFALCANLNFDRIAASNYTEFHYELLPETYAKLEGYEGTWDLWQEGIKNRLLVPQFHGREHLNLKVFKEKLAAKDSEVLTALQNKSYTGISKSGYSSISYTAAFDFWDMQENEAFEGVIEDGLNSFEKVFGYRATHFNPPGGREHPIIHEALKKNGIKYLDVPSSKQEHQGHGKYTTVYNYMGKKNKLGMYYLIRNCIFEPNEKRISDWAGHAMKGIESAFSHGKPAVISSHRVNFCGLIDEKNRKNSLTSLKDLLHKITKRWPDVEFMTSNEVGDLYAQADKA